MFETDSQAEGVSDGAEQLRERMLRAAQQFARELVAAGADAEMIGEIHVEVIPDGVTVHFWAAPKDDVTEDDAKG